MKTLQSLESAFLQGTLPKPEYIAQMYELHDRLFEYAEFIASRDIEEIVITPNCVKVRATLPETTGGGGEQLRRVGFGAKNGDCGGESAVITTQGNSLDSPCKAPFLSPKSNREQVYLESKSHDFSSTILESRSGGENYEARGGTISLLLQRGCERMTPLEILNFRHYERLDSAMIFALVRDGDIVLDIGGNIGYYSIALAKMRNATIHTFEPIESTYKQLVANVYYNGVQDRVRINNFGLFDKSGELTFYVYKQDFGNASAAIMHEERDNEKIVCKVEQLDEYVKEQGLARIDFIKLDVEGAEIFALKGGLKSIEQHKPILFVEMLRKWAAKYGYHPNEIIGMLEGLGYECYYACERDSALRLTRLETMTDQTQETNFFFLHKEKHKAYIKQLTLESIFENTP